MVTSSSPSFFPILLSNVYPLYYIYVTYSIVSYSHSLTSQYTTVIYFVDDIVLIIIENPYQKHIITTCEVLVVPRSFQNSNDLFFFSSNLFFSEWIFSQSFLIMISLIPISDMQCLGIINDDK